MTRTISIFSAAVLSLSLFGTGIDNAPLLPKWVGDSEVKLECLSEDATASTDWVKSLIIVEANVATASTDGTLAGMSRVLDHLAETGVNGLWLTPVNERPHYGNFGIDRYRRYSRTMAPGTCIRAGSAPAEYPGILRCRLLGSDERRAALP